jgi:Tachylectin
MASGDLLWYQHLGRSAGTENWANGGGAKQVGTGWNFKQVFAADDGVIYAIDQAGALLWFQHLGRSDGTVNWANGGGAQQVGNGWEIYKQVFAADDGVIYAIDEAGALLWYRHLGRSDGTENWASGGLPKQVGTGWNDFNQVFAADDAVVYVVLPTPVIQ